MTDNDTTGQEVALPSDAQRAEIAQAREDVQRPTDDRPMSELVAWAFDASQAHRVAISLSGTDFVPRAMRGKPDQVTGAILTGYELGLKPMAALRSIDVIQGTPAIRANAMRALVQQAGHRIIVVETDDQHCVMKGRRKDDPEDEWTTVTWTLARAQRAGLTQKDTWKQYPDEMLLARATGQLSRLIAADVILGVPYTAEEVRDMDTEAPQAVTSGRVSVQELLGEATPAPEPAAPASEAPRTQHESEGPVDTASQKADGERFIDQKVEDAPAPVLAAQPDEPVEAQVEPDPNEPKATARQVGAVHSLAAKLGLATGAKADRTDYLVELSEAAGRPMTSSKDLTAVEAGRVIEAWQALADKAPPTTDDGSQQGGGWG